jgi:hypothetical protein
MCPFWYHFWRIFFLIGWVRGVADYWMLVAVLYQV